MNPTTEKLAKHVKKMSTKVILDKTPNARMLPEGDNASLHLYNAFGIARGVKTGSSNFGEWTCFTGDFCAIDPQGNEYRSTKVFLPDVVTLPLINSLAESKEGVKFAFAIGIKAAKTQVGYEYYAAPLVAPKESDALTDLKNQVLPLLANQAQAALPAPGTAATSPIPAAKPQNQTAGNKRQAVGAGK